MQSTYNSMLQQQAIEGSLRSEISADQVQIEQLKDGIRVGMKLDKNGKGDGHMLVAARISFDQGGELVIEHFDVQPVLLTDIQPLAY